MGHRRTTSLVAALACLGYTALAVASGLDRMSLVRPELARLVPAPFASQALRSEGAALIEAGATRKALAKGEAAVADAPLDPASTALLGVARMNLGDRAGAERAFRVAGKLGWRDPFTQAYWMGRAIESGDWRVAAMRLDALLRQRPALLAERRLLDPLETAPAGRAALAERMLALPGWLRQYTAAVTDVPRPVLLLRSQVLGEAAARRAVLGCETVAPLVERLVNESAEREADELWSQHCPNAGAALVHDGQFATASLQQYRGPFDWSFVGQSDATILLEPTGKRDAHRLTIEAATTRPRQLARQMVLLTPGVYRLSWQAQTPEETPSDLAIAALSCTANPGEWPAARFDTAKHRWTAQFRVGDDCRAHWLSLGVRVGNGTVTFGDIRLEAEGQDGSASPR